MSYILDALKRAESERGRGLVPGFHEQMAPGALPDEGASTRLGGRVGMALGVLLVLGLVGGSALWMRGTGEGTNRSDLKSSEAVASRALPGPVPSTTAPAPARPQPSLPAAVVQLKPEESAPLLPVQERTSAAAKPSAAPSERLSASSAVPAAGLAADAHVLRWAQLPEDIRRELPPLNLGGSMYSEAVQNRMLILNGRLLHEGDLVAPGLVLEQIRPKSAVLVFKGRKFEIGN